MKKLAVMTVSAMFALGAAQVASAANSVADGIKTNQPNSANAAALPKTHAMPAKPATPVANANGHDAKSAGTRGLGTPTPSGFANGHR